MTKSRKFGQMARISAVLLTIGGIFAIGEAQEFVKNGTFSDYLLNSGEAINSTNNGYLYRNTDVGTVIDDRTYYNPETGIGTYIADWYYVAATATTDHAAGINNRSISTFSGSTNISLPANNALFVQREGEVYTYLEGLTVGDTYYIAFDYSSRSGTNHNGYLGLSVSSADSGSALQVDPFFVNCNSHAFYKTAYEFVANAEDMELRFFMNTVDTGDRATAITNVSVKSVDAQGWGLLKVWNSDDTSRILSDGVYTHAVNICGSDVPVNPDGSGGLNGIAFVGLSAGTDAAREIVIGGSNVTNNASTSCDDAASTAVMTNFVNDNPAITLSGLIPGLEYELLIMGSSYANTNRQATLSVNGLDATTFNEFGFIGATMPESGTTGGYKSHEGCTLTWRGNATADGELKLTMEKVSNDTWHVYGIANRAILPDNLLMATSFSGLNGIWNDGREAGGTTMDHVNLYSPAGEWQKRGSSNVSNVATPVIFNGNTNPGTPSEGIVLSGVVASGGNAGLATEFNVAAISADYSEIRLSADIMIGDLKYNDGGSTDPLQLNRARGVGLGFFNEAGVWADSNEVSLGFSGLVVTPNGDVYFRSNQTDSIDGGTRGELFEYGTGFSTDEFYNLSMDFRLNDNGTATLIGAIFEGSDANFADLIAEEYTFDLGGLNAMVGFLTSSQGAYGDFGYIDNFMLTGITPQSGNNATPEPATWVMMLLAAAGVVFLRRRTG